MANLADYVWGVAPQHFTVAGAVTVEGEFVRVVAAFSWTAFLPNFQGNAAINPIWLALPRDQFDAADTDVYGGFPPSAGDWGIFNLTYDGPWFDAYDPTLGYIGTAEVNGDDDYPVFELIKGDCYLFLTVQDLFPAGTMGAGSMDVKWRNGPGIAPMTALPGSVSALGAVGGAVRSSHRRVAG